MFKIQKKKKFDSILYRKNKLVLLFSRVCQIENLLAFSSLKKDTILAIFQCWLNGTFKPLHEVQNIFCSKDFFWSDMKVTVNNICNVSQGPPNPGFRSVIVEYWEFLKKDSKDFKNSFQFGFPWIPSKPGKQN